MNKFNSTCILQFPDCSFRIVHSVSFVPSPSRAFNICLPAVPPGSPSSLERSYGGTLLVRNAQQLCVALGSESDLMIERAFSTVVNGDT